MITRMVLRNFLSYADADVDFTNGVNSITGLSGSGKSNIVAAIGWGVFNYNPFDNVAALARFGCKYGEVEINLGSATITRSTKGGWTFFNGENIYRSAGDVQEQIAIYLGLDPGISLSTLWQNFICLQQLKMLHGFDDTESVRRGIFNQILDVDRYTRAWKYLGQTSTYIKDGIAKLETEMAVAEARGENYEAFMEHAQRLLKRKSDLEMVEGPDKSGIDRMKSEYEEWKRRVSTYNLNRQRIDHLDGTIARLTREIDQCPSRYDPEEIKRITAQRDAINSNCVMYREKSAQLESLRMRKPSFDLNRYNTLVKSELQLKKDVDDIGKEHTAILSSAWSRVTALNKRLSDIKLADGSCPTCGEPMSKQKFNSIFAEITDDLARANHELDEIDAHADPLGMALDGAVREHEEVSRNLNDMLPGFAALSAWEADDGDGMIESLSNEVKRLEGYDMGQVEVLGARIDELNRAGIMFERLPGMKDELSSASKERARLFEMNSNTNLDFDEAEYNRKLDSYSAEMARYNEAVAEMRQVTERLVEVDGQIESALSAREAASHLMSRISGGKAKLERLERIRTAIKGAAQHVSHALVSEVSSVANRMFSNALQGHCDASLVWNMDYSLSVTKDGREMGWQVSGGERTLAALCVRLAMHRVLGKVGLLVADEVTMGTMDPILQQVVPDLMRDSDLTQIITIDHGGLFSDVATNLIKVEYDGASHV